MPGFTPAAYSTSQTEIGVGIEQSRGTAATSVLWLPAKAPKYKPNLTMITDDTLQGSMVQTYGLVPGLRYDSHGWDAYPRLDTFPMLLRAALGSPDTLVPAPAATTLVQAAVPGATTVTLTTAPTAGTWIVIGTGDTREAHLIASVAGDVATLTEPVRFAQTVGAAVAGLTGHQFSLLNNAGTGNQPPSCTIQDFDGQQWRQIVAAQLSQLTIKGTATGLVDYTVTFDGNAATVLGVPPTVAFSTVSPVPAWTTQLSIAGQPVGYLEEWEIELNRKVSQIAAFTGTENYYLHYAGPLEATGKFTFVEQANAPQLAAYEAGIAQPFDLTVGDIRSGYAMQIHSSSAAYTGGSVERSKAYAQVQLDVTALPSSADATAGGVSPVLITVANGTATAF